jgi:hypothetical protein
MDKKVQAILARGEAVAPKDPKPLRTAFTDREVNAYFKFNGQPHIPTGVVEPQVTIEDSGRVRARAFVDLDAIRKSKSRTLLDPLNWVAGSLEVTAVGTLRAQSGTGTFVLENATLGGVTVPKSLLQELVYYYSRTADSPNGFNLDKPFELPAKIQTIEIRRGAATIIQ